MNNEYMKPNGRGDYVCDCCKKRYKGNFYGWTSIVTHSYLGLICEKCAIKETFGNYCLGYQSKPKDVYNLQFRMDRNRWTQRH